MVEIIEMLGISTERIEQIKEKYNPIFEEAEWKSDVLWQIIEDDTLNSSEKTFAAFVYGMGD